MTGKPPATERIATLLKAGGRRRLTLAYDTRDHPPWTAELEIDGRVIAIRPGANLQDAITAAHQGAAQRAAELAAQGVKPKPLRDPRGRA